MMVLAQTTYSKSEIAPTHTQCPVQEQTKDGGCAGPNIEFSAPSSPVVIELRP